MNTYIILRPHVSVVTGNILITITRLVLYNILLASNRTFMTGSQYLIKYLTQVWQNLTEHHYYLTLSKSGIGQIDAYCSPFHSLSTLPFHIRSKSLKLIYYSLISICTTDHFKTGTLCLLFVSSHIFIALALDSILL